MKILFTGASSFTGMHFVQALLRDGHEVHCTFTRPSLAYYSDLEQHRIDSFSKHVHSYWRVQFGHDAFNELLDNGYDAICHHGAIGQSGDHNNADFDVLGALENNTYNAAATIRTAKRAGVKKFILTGTYLEKYQYSNGSVKPNKSAYALSKHLTSEMFEFLCKESEISFMKFSVPNPFGPFENFRFTSSAALAWLSGKFFKVQNPTACIDNIPVGLLALCYAKFVNAHHSFLAPSGYTNSQRDFALLFAKEMQPRLKVECPLVFSYSPDVVMRSDYDRNVDSAIDYISPRDSLGNRPSAPGCLPWSEEKFWDDLAEYYLTYHRKFLT